MIKHPRTKEEWSEVLAETTLDGVGVGNLTSNSTKVCVYPDPILTHISYPVAEEDYGTEKLAKLCERMHGTMSRNKGIGLSAVQIGVLERIVTMRITETDRYDVGSYDVSRPYNFINPKILELNGSFTFSEGCLSVPGYFEERERANKILLQFHTIHGDKMVEEFEGLEAFCIQHEIDHLNGKLFVDDLSPLKKERVRKTIKKTLRRQKSEMG